MKALVTGGAGFIGRWVAERLLGRGYRVAVFDDFSSGRRRNLDALDAARLEVVEGDVRDPRRLASVFERGPWDALFHLAASIHVQKSIDDPGATFRNDAEGTFALLEAARAQYFRLNGLNSGQPFDHDTTVPRLVDRRPRMVCVSTCMVYEPADERGIAERHPYRPTSPYAASKIAADMIALAYAHCYRMPVVVVRPFNTYGPFQKSDSEGGVVSIFLKRDIAGEPLLVKGSGRQTRDLLYVEDCAEFIVRAAFEPALEGRVLNAGTGRDVSIAALAAMCCSDGNRVEHVPHDHPQSEIERLLCDASLAAQLLGWTPRVGLEEGLARTRAWLAQNRWAW